MIKEFKKTHALVLTHIRLIYNCTEMSVLHDLSNAAERYVTGVCLICLLLVVLKYARVTIVFIPLPT